MFYLRTQTEGKLPDLAVRAQHYLFILFGLLSRYGDKKDQIHPNQIKYFGYIRAKVFQL